MKTGKTIVSVLVMAVVLSCSLFPVFADGTPSRKTITSSTYSYNDGDVSVYVRVNGGYSGSDGTSSSVSTKHANYQHTFDVVLVNNTNEFQVASSNSFIVKLYSGSSSVFAPSVSGEGSYHAGWGATVDSFSDNMSAPEVIFHRTGDYAGNVFISFTDNDLLVLNPNETRTYSFTITFLQAIDVNYSYLNGNYMYSYFTYTGNVDFYSRPESFTANTINDFIGNDSLPDSAIAYYQYLLQQGIEDQELYNSILSAIMHKTNISSFANTQYTSIYDSSFTIMNEPSTIDMRVIAPRPHLYIADFEVNDQSGNSGSLNLYCQPIYFVIRSINNTDNTFQLSSNRFAFNYSVTNSNTNLVYYSYDFELISSENILATDVSNNSITIQFTNKYNNLAIIPSADNSYMLLKVNYYYISGNYDSSFDPINTGVPSISITNLPSLSASLFSQKWYYSIYKNFADLRDRLDSLIDLLTGDTSTNDNISQESQAAESTADTIHAQEEQWYQQNEAAIQSSGLSNYQFSTNQLSGIGTISSQFSSVWNALGDWTLVYVFVLLLSLATFIIRHRPSTKMQQRVATMEREQFINKSVRAQRDSLYRHYWERYHK